MEIVKVEGNSSIPKYKQIVVSIEEAISNGSLKKGDKLPSLNSVKNEYDLSRDTVLMAFNELKTRGIAKSIVGKGYYIVSEEIGVIQKIFLMFDELNSFKEDLYKSFLSSLGENVQVDIFFHHFNHDVFRKLIYDNVGSYSSYVIMPANLEGAAEVIDRLPKDKVYILDQTNEELSEYPSIYQNFQKNIFNGLKDSLSLLQKYAKLILVFPPEKQPKGIRIGFELFCKEYAIANEVVSSIKGRRLEKGDAYLLLDDENLLRLIKSMKEENLLLAEDIGVISYNDTLLKEIVSGGITVISTDFEVMGARLAEIIIGNEHVQIENPNKLIIRNSL
ncbi:GntR family transcriptional regulator [Cellulophaga sp. L1A9]|uniref:GntR family transcriptional regulator n=1 Tax=Cellulophaga sp. L1A9 TaxID=2686362 RepID=UPI00131CF6B6|nr:GntR family transcriptional regulator [Cellulophaga sp. L1A9]